jgi:hypothetical protein
MSFPLNLDPPLDISAVHAGTQHAAAGRAALGLLQDTTRDASTIRPDSAILDHVRSLVQFAQKAEMSRKILERYLLGTEIARIDPVYVPSPPPSYSDYTYPSLDDAVIKSKHMPLNVNPRPSPFMGPMSNTTSSRLFSPYPMPPMQGAPLMQAPPPVMRGCGSDIVLIFNPLMNESFQRRVSISNFI